MENNLKNVINTIKNTNIKSNIDIENLSNYIGNALNNNFDYKNGKELLIKTIFSLENTQQNQIKKQILVYEIYKYTLNFQKRFTTQFYNTNNNNKFIILLISSHGKDIDKSLNVPNVNSLIFNLSSVPGVSSYIFDDNIVEQIINNVNNSISNNSKNSTFVSIANNLTTLKKSYQENISNKYLQSILDPISTIEQSQRLKLADEYKQYSCRVTKPIKDKEYKFVSIFTPGIYVLGGANCLENEILENEIPKNEIPKKMLNLLVNNDLQELNKLFGEELDFGQDIFQTNLDSIPTTLYNPNSTILLSQILNYFKDLGIYNVGIIDLSCRSGLTIDNIERNKQMVLEELGICGNFPTFGGVKHKGIKYKGKNKLKKNKKSIKRNKC